MASSRPTFDEQRLRELFERALRPVDPDSASASASDLEPWRERIDELDLLLTTLLNLRATFATAIGHIKSKVGLPVYTPSREQEVLENVIRANPGPLDERAVRRLFERIIDETRSLERRLTTSDHEDPDDPGSTGHDRFEHDR